jgi:hypothetical protein
LHFASLTAAYRATQAEDVNMNTRINLLALVGSVMLALVPPLAAADSDLVRTWLKDKHWTVVQTHDHTSQAQSCELTGVQGIATLSISQNDKGDDPRLSYQERGARWTFGGVRLQIDRDAPWGVEPLAFQPEPDLLVVPLRPVEAGERFLAAFLNGNTLSITPSHSRSRVVSLAGVNTAFDKLTNCLETIRR